MKPNTTNEIDYVKLYGLEDYLFDVVRPRFQQEGSIGAFDFFCIVIWKANRAKSNIARRMIKKGYNNLEDACYTLTDQIYKAPSPEEKMKVMMKEWGFLLPTTSAVLTVLYPDQFTVYDVRVCEVLGKYNNLKNFTNFERLWQTYQDFISDVKRATPGITKFRDKDRYLWGKSFHEQLKNDIKKQFS